MLPNTLPKLTVLPDKLELTLPLLVIDELVGF
jgi:hypothetical protein